MGNRKQPFGYKMEFGEIVPQPQEAETIRSIYLQYLAGASFKQLTEQLQAEDVPYECFLLGKHTVERVCSGLSPLRRDRLWC